MAKFRIIGSSIVTLVLESGQGLTLQPGTYELPENDEAVKRLVARGRIVEVNPAVKAEAPKAEVKPVEVPSIPVPVAPEAPKAEAPKAEEAPEIKPEKKGKKKGKSEAPKEEAPAGEEGEGFDESALDND